MGPTIVFDKSFIQSLNIEELFELCIFFEPVGTDILRKEILADLEKKSTQRSDTPAVIKSLCTKMSRSGIETMEYRRAALTELATGTPIEMHGGILIDASAPHVRFAGGGVHIDGREIQWDWRRWAAGQFTNEEREMAKAHRQLIADFDPDAYCKQHRPFALKHFGDCTNLELLAKRIDGLIEDHTPMTQELILNLTLTHLSAPAHIQQRMHGLFRAGKIGRLKDVAPYATATTRIIFVYQIALARGFFGPRKSDVCDLEYLYYAPFCRVFVSDDRLHKALWRATTTNALFCRGSKLKADLNRRAALRRQDRETVAGPFPIPLDDSVITDIFRQLRERKSNRKAGTSPATGEGEGEPQTGK